MTRVALSWSSGKDSAWTLHRLHQDPGVEVVARVTTANAEFNRVAMHVVRQKLLQAQAGAVGCRSSKCRFRFRAATPITDSVCAH